MICPYLDVSEPSIQILKVYPTSAYLNLNFDGGGLLPDKVMISFNDTTCKNKETTPSPQLHKTVNSTSMPVMVENLVVDCTYRFFIVASNTELNVSSNAAIGFFTIESGNFMLVS